MHAYVCSFEHKAVQLSLWGHIWTKWTGNGHSIWRTWLKELSKANESTPR